MTIKCLTYILMTVLAIVSQAKENFVVENVNFSLKQLPKSNTIVVGYQMFSWEEWTGRDSAQILFGEKDPTTPESERSSNFVGFPVRVFELKASFVVDKDIKKFNKAYLTDVKRWKKIDSYNSYSKISVNETKKIIEPKHYYQNELMADSILFKSSIQLPSNSFINSAINWYRENKSQDAKSDYSAITTIQELFYDDNLEADIKDLLTKQVGLPYKNTPVDRYLLQTMFYADHFMRFGSTFIHFQELAPNKTMVTLQLALAINKNILFNYFGMNTEELLVHGTPIPLCNLCAGLVELSKTTLVNMKNEFNQ